MKFFFSILPITFNFTLLLFFGWNLNSFCQQDTDTCTFFCYISFVASKKTLRLFSPTRLISFKERRALCFLHDDHLVAMTTRLLTPRNQHVAGILDIFSPKRSLSIKILKP